MIRHARLIDALLALCIVTWFAPGIGAAHAQGQQVKPTQRKLVISGSALLAPLISDVSHRFEQLNPGAAIEIRRVGSAEAVAEVRMGASDIAMLSRGVLDSERDLFAYPIARDGVAILVQRTNPVKNLSTRQLTDVLIGRITNWKALGGRDQPIHVGWRSKGQGSVELILDHLDIRRDQIAPHTTVIANADAIRFAATDASGVTLASVGESERDARAGAAIKLLAFNGVPASNRTVQNRTYALSRPLTLATRELPDGLRKRFIDYALSSEVVDLQLKHSFVPYQE